MLHKKGCLGVKTCVKAVVTFEAAGTPRHRTARAALRSTRTGSGSATAERLLAYSGDSAPGDAIVGARARRRSVPLRGDAAHRRSRRPSPRASLARGGQDRLPCRRRPGSCCSHIALRSSRRRPATSLPTTGSSVLSSAATSAQRPTPERAPTCGYDVRRAVAVAQLVEPRVVVPVVAGSNPVRHPFRRASRGGRAGRVVPGRERPLAHGQARQLSGQSGSLRSCERWFDSTRGHQKNLKCCAIEVKEAA